MASDDPVITTDSFTMSIKDEEGKISFFKDFNLVSLDILEVVNSIPYYTLKIKPNPGTDAADMIQSVKNFKLTYSSQKLNYISYLGIDEIHNDTFTPENMLTITGWLTKQENFRPVNTRYLANNVKTALSKLDIVTGDIKMKGNPNFDIFQINKTNIETALSLCRTSAETPFWSIGRYSINLEKATDTDEYDDITPVMGTVYQTPNNTFTQWNSGKMNYKKKRPSGGNIIKAQGSPNNYLISSTENECFQDFLINEEFWSGNVSALAVSQENTEFIIPMGTKVKHSTISIPGIDYWIVGACYYHYNIHSAPNTMVQYMGMPEAKL